MPTDKNNFAIVQTEKQDGNLVSVIIRETDRSDVNTYKLNLINGNFESLTVLHNDRHVGSFEKKDNGVVSVTKAADAGQHELFAEYQVKTGESVNLPGRDVFWINIRNQQGMTQFFLNTKFRVFQLETGNGKRARFTYDEASVQRVSHERKEDSLAVQIVSDRLQEFDQSNLCRKAILAKISELDLNVKQNRDLLMQIKFLLARHLKGDLDHEKS